MSNWRTSSNRLAVSFAACAVMLVLAVLPVSATEGLPVDHTPIQDEMDARIYGVNDPVRDRSLKQDDDFGESSLSGTPTEGKKSVFKAALYSALVPGGGQYYLGQKKTARYFFVGEALTWIGYASFRIYGNWKKDDYIELAAAKANAQLEGKDDEFVDLVGFYTDIREYNTLGRIFEPDRPYLTDTPENHWQWQTYKDLREFRDLKNQSRESYRRGDFMIGVAVVARVVSIIDAVRNVKRVNRRISRSASLEGQNWQLTVDPLDQKRQVRFSFYPGF